MTIFETIESAGRTHVGKVRKQNEDSFLERREIGLWAVADGMGGLDAGDVASALVVDELKGMPAPDTPASLLRDCCERLQAANDAIREEAASRGRGSMGTTVAILLASESYFACLWAGDSRIYRIRAREIAQLTRDHSEAQDMVDQGLLSADDARNWPRRNVITRAVGVFPELELDLEHGEIESGDVFVLCSDGLTGHVEDAEIAALVASTPVEQGCDALIRTVLERGAQDNVTVIVVRFASGERTVIAPRPSPGSGQGWS